MPSPVSDWEACKLWLLAQKHLPRGTRALLDELAAQTPKPAFPPPAGAKQGAWQALQSRLTGGVVSGHPPETERAPGPPAPSSDPVGGTGAAFAKERLDEAEREAARRHKEAVASGNPAAIRASLDAWTKLLGEVRQFHSAVAREERVGGDKVPLAEAVTVVGRLVHGLAVTLRQSMQPLAHVLAGAAPGTAADALGAACNAYVAALGGVATAPAGAWVAAIPPLPEWARRGVAEGLAWPYGPQAEAVLTETARKLLEQAPAGAASEAKGPP